MKTTILWDHDGVLVETEPLFFEATRIQLKSLGVSLNKSDYIRDMARGISAWKRAAAAVEAGIDCVVVKNDFVRGQDLSSTTHQIDTLADLPALLARM